MLKGLTIKEQETIAKNVVAACVDINKLTKKAYNYINQCCGFIAHYNHQGFIHNYSDESLAADILRNKNNASCNRRENDSDYEYYKSKSDTYEKILSLLFRGIHEYN